MIKLLLLLVSFNLFAADVLVEPPSNGGDAMVKLASGKLVPVSVAFTTDGAGALQPLSASSGLPTGASTSALQTTGNSSLSSIDGKITAVNTGADTFTATGDGVTVDASANPVKVFSLLVKATGAVTSWDVRLECSLDNTNFTTVLTHTNVVPGDGVMQFSLTALSPCLYFRSRVAAFVLGGGTNIVVTILGMH